MRPAPPTSRGGDRRRADQLGEAVLDVHRPSTDGLTAEPREVEEHALPGAHDLSAVVDVVDPAVRPAVGIGEFRPLEDLSGLEQEEGGALTPVR